LNPVWSRYLLAVASCALTTLLALPLRGWLDLANIVMLFLLVVFVIAVRLGRGPAVLAAFLGVAAFDVFFVHPYLSFGVDDAQYLVTFAVMLAVGLIASHQAAQLVARTEEGKAREHAIQTEKLRASILSSISHDLRTPLTSLVGMADTLADQRAGLPTEVGEKAGIIRDQAHAMHRMVSNLLDMARLQSGRVAMNLQWQPLEEIVGSSVRLLDDVLSAHPLVIDLPNDLPLIRFDAVLMERVLCNLLENAAKYSPPESAITLRARTRDDKMEVSICNAGSAFPAEHPEQVFDLFARGLQEPAIAGTGIGLAICRAIIVAHEGTIVAGNRDQQACVSFTLPLGTPPQVEGE
jgi:two-component system sensor histidine kinase KdpD